jgi:hypothetical protein
MLAKFSPDRPCACCGSPDGLGGPSLAAAPSTGSPSRANANVVEDRVKTQFLRGGPCSDAARQIARTAPRSNLLESLAVAGVSPSEPPKQRNSSRLACIFENPYLPRLVAKCWLTKPATSWKFDSSARARRHQIQYFFRHSLTSAPHQLLSVNVTRSRNNRIYVTRPYEYEMQIRKSPEITSTASHSNTIRHTNLYNYQD